MCATLDPPACEYAYLAPLARTVPSCLCAVSVGVALWQPGPPLPCPQFWPSCSHAVEDPPKQFGPSFLVMKRLSCSKRNKHWSTSQRSQNAKWMKALPGRAAELQIFPVFSSAAVAAGSTLALAFPRLLSAALQGY